MSVWGSISNSVKKRDYYKCQRCKTEYAPRALSIHHIQPRSEGGGDYIENLITLCHKCHDVIEAEHEIYLSVELIMNSYPVDPYIEPDVDIVVSDDGVGIPYTDEYSMPVYPFGYVDRHRPSWHCIVYGSGVHDDTIFDI